MPAAVHAWTICADRPVAISKPCSTTTRGDRTCYHYGHPRAMSDMPGLASVRRRSITDQQLCACTCLDTARCAVRSALRSTSTKLFSCTRTTLRSRGPLRYDTIRYDTPQLPTSSLAFGQCKEGWSACRLIICVNLSHPTRRPHPSSMRPNAWCILAVCGFCHHLHTFDDPERAGLERHHLHAIV
jgi:hypothetical protein